MLKKIVLDWLLPAVAIGVVVVVGIFIAQKLGILGGGQAAPPTEMRTVDTPEYKAIDSTNKALEKRNMYLEMRDSLRSEVITRIEEQINNSKIKYKNETKRVENNTADVNFIELQSIISTRRKTGK